MYDIDAVENGLFSSFEKSCETCALRMNCDDMTNSEVAKCFYAYVSRRVDAMLRKNNMNVDVWTWNGDMIIRDLVHLYIYLSVEAESASPTVEAVDDV